jgi:circadian clock protein KaiB
MQLTGLADFESASKSAAEAIIHLRLYISGITPRSTVALANLKSICEQYLPDRYQLEIVDIYQQPRLAKEDQILAVPTLVRLKPLPTLRLVGDLSDTSKVLRSLNLKQ